MPITLDFMIGLPLEKRGPSYTAARLAEGMDDPACRTRLFTPLDRWPEPGLSVPVISGAIGSKKLVNAIPFRISQPVTRRIAEHRLIAESRRTGGGRRIIFLWGEIPLALAHRLKALDVTVVREKFNCGKAVAKAILDDAYGRLGLEPAHQITDAMIAKEHEELHLADAVYCPNAMVAESLRAIDIPDSKLIPTSYGWEPERFTGTDRALDPADGPTFLFVGTICVRKGAHILLEAWKRAGIKGRLVLAGKIEPAIDALYRDVFDREDVLHVPFTPSVGAFYRSADWFVFPSLEEGGPQVTYEAGGCGVPGIVSRMGGGAFTRDGIDGRIVASDDPDAWAEALTEAAARPDLRAEYGRNALARADQFTWTNVAAQRRAALIDRYAGI